MSRPLYDALDFLVANVQSVRMRDQHKQFRAGIALLDRHRLWKPRSADDTRASAAIVATLVQIIYNLFGDVNETTLFRTSDRQCGELCAKFVVAFALQRDGKVREFWTYSRYGRASAIER